MAQEDTEYKKLALEERCIYKLWKARVEAYEELAKLFREIDDEKSPEWNKYGGLIKKFVVDSNAVAQEKGLEVALVFVENCANAGRTVNDVMSGIVQKCIAAPKTKTKELAVQVTLMYVEIEKQDAVIEELVKGMEHKNPKTVAACVSVTTLALHEFGSKVVSVKPMIKKLAPLMSDRDKTVREEGKQLAVEIFRWIGAAMKAQIASLPQVTIKELEDEFDKVKDEKPVPTRYLKSQQAKQQQISSARANADAADEVADGEADVETEIDPLDLIDPVDILSKLPKDFYEKLEEKKWTLRKESLEAIEKLLTDHPKLESGDYAPLVSALKKVLSKDTNVVLVAMAGKCLAMLAKGLAKRFGPYAMACLSAVLEKFKEKKTNVVTALREASDAIYPSTSLEAMQELIVESLGNKNPSVKSETASFLSRSFARTQPTAINKKLLKLLVTTLIKTLNEPDPTTRDNSAEALGTLIKLMGEKLVAPYLTDVDALKMAKIKECQEKAEIVVKIPGAKPARPATAPTQKQVAPAAAINNNDVQEAKPARPATAVGAKKPVSRKTVGSGSANAPAATTKTAAATKPLATEREMTPEEVQAKAEDTFPADILSGLADSNWKNRLAAVEQIVGLLPDFDSKQQGISQVIMRTIRDRKPGLKEMNFQVLKIKLDILRLASESFPVTTTTLEFLLNDVTEKLADIKNGNVAADVLTAFAAATKLEFVVNRTLSFALEQKSPKVQSETFNWVSKAIMEFGFQVQSKLLIEDVRKGVQSTNPTVRSAAINLVGNMSMYMGTNTLLMFFENEKPALKTQIQEACDKHAGEKPPKPIRGVSKTATTAKEAANEDDEACQDDAGQEAQFSLADLLPRVDISSQITETLLKEMSDKDWKTRNEGLNKLQAILSEAKVIKPAIGDLGLALAQRLLDSNAKIAQTALAICEQLATAMGAPCKGLVRTLFPGFLNALGDSKAFVRAAALSCITTFGENGGYKEFFEAEMIADALKTGSPALKSELWCWLADKLPLIPPKTIPKDELTSMMPYLYAHISDRNAEVRKNANEAVLGIMMHLGYEAMLKGSDKQKPAAKKDIQAALDKARPNLPIKPLPKGKAQAPIIEEPARKTVRGGGGGASKANAVGSKAAAEKTVASSRKKEEDVDTSPLLAVNNAKNQRLIDEQKMRVLKWAFTTPREEFTEQLRDQMTVANVNKGLMANMFHDDFRYHLKVIESLNEDLQENSKALICNLDLILKWLSLRFYDTNPSVLIKGLEYINQVFQLLIEKEYMLAEHEANAFIPHLLLKIGDPKDSVRNGVRTILRQIVLFYPYSKVFVYLMDALKSKNARQRTECLDELGFLIETYGLTACQPTQQVALKEIARHIADRDNSVRNAAMNAIVQVYFLAGEKTFKLVGQISEKDMSMLDERIKRAKKSRKFDDTATVAPTAPKAISPNNAHYNEVNEGVMAHSDELPPVDDEALSDTHGTFDQPGGPTAQFNHQPQQQQLPQQPQRPSGPFGLDSNIIAAIERDWVRVDQMAKVNEPNIDVSFLFDPIQVLNSRDGGKYPSDKFEQLLARSLYMQQHGTVPTPTVTPFVSPQPVKTYVQSPPNRNIADILPKQLDPELLRIIRGISSPDSMCARGSMVELSEIIESAEKQIVLRDYEELFVENVLQQLTQLTQAPLNESMYIYQPLLSILYAFFASKSLGKTLGIECLKNLMAALLNLMADLKVSGNGNEGQHNKVINGICLKVLDKANFTNLNCALIRLLKETCPSAGLPKFTDLLMKCIWRNVKILPERSDELDYDAVLSEVHEFMSALPSAWWQTRPSDTPMRTVKTIVHNMAKVKGNQILSHVNQIPPHSELHAYLIRILKNMNKEGRERPTSGRSTANTNETKLQSAQSLRESVTKIFAQISKPETKDEGLRMLYDLKQKHSEMDIRAILNGCSADFQQFIEDGLAEIDQNVGKTSTTTTNSVPGANDNRLDANHHQQGSAMNGAGAGVGGVEKLDADFWMGHLNSLLAKNKHAVERQADGNNYKKSAHNLDNRASDENHLSFNNMTTQKLTFMRKDRPSNMSPVRLQSIQSKLAQIKQQDFN